MTPGQSAARPLLVIGAPRSGFTPLISVLTEIRIRSGEAPSARQSGRRPV